MNIVVSCSSHTANKMHVCLAVEKKVKRKESPKAILCNTSQRTQREKGEIEERPESGFISLPLFFSFTFPDFFSGEKQRVAQISTFTLPFCVCVNVQ